MELDLLKPATEPQESEREDISGLEAIKFPITPAIAGEEGARRVVMARQDKKRQKQRYR